MSIFRRPAKPTQLKGILIMENDSDKRISELEGLVRQATSAIKRNRDEIEELKSLVKTLAKPSPNNSATGARTFGPPKERNRQALTAPHMDGNHVIPDPVNKRQVLAEERQKSGLKAHRGQMIVTICDEPRCVAGHHQKVMKKEDGAPFNAHRVGNELATMNRTEVQFELDALGTWLADDHFLPAEETYTLPSTRQIGIKRAMYWAFRDTVGEVPRFVRATCGRGDCVAAEHLKVDR